MTLGLLTLEIFIPECNSLKERRMRLNSLKARLRNSFNVSVAQVDGEDKWQKAAVAVAGVAKDKRGMESELSKILEFVKRVDNVSIINYETELI